MNEASEGLGEASGGRKPPVLVLNRGLTTPARSETRSEIRHETYVEALAEYDGPGPSLFLAGGISGTFDWQADMIARLADLPLVLLNPRRRDFPINDPSAAPTQIEWEFRHIRKATAVLFWFPPETLCPIALFELGGRVMTPQQPLFVGTHPDYARRLDVEVQLRLARPEVVVASDLTVLAKQVRDWMTAQA